MSDISNHLLLETQDICSICEKRVNNYNYSCCQQAICRECLNQWNLKNKTCPFCRSHHTISTPKKYKSGFLDKFSNLIENYPEIKECVFYPRYLAYINTIQQIADHHPNFKLQVNNTNKIHVFNYQNINDLNFVYDANYNLVQVQGGDYYLRDQLIQSNTCWWWLHAFVREI